MSDADKVKRLAARLRELSNAVTKANWSEFSMRIPAQPDHDADLVLDAAANLLEREHENAERLRSARKIVDQQAEDEGLWFVAAFATEAYLQTALRELHEAVETGAARKGEK